MCTFPRDFWEPSAANAFSLVWATGRLGVWRVMKKKCNSQKMVYSTELHIASFFEVQSKTALRIATLERQSLRVRFKINECQSKVPGSHALERIFVLCSMFKYNTRILRQILCSVETSSLCSVSEASKLYDPDTVTQTKNRLKILLVAKRSHGGVQKGCDWMLICWVRET